MPAMPEMMNAIAIENPGKSSVLKLTSQPRPEPKAGEVLIKVAAAGMNRADLAQAQGNYPPPPGASEILGLEVSGEIVALGSGVAGFRIGDKVCALLGGGGYAEYATAHVECILPVPKGVSVVDAAALPEVHFTVWTNLMDAARLAPGESVLIHGGSSGIGTAAIQLCKARGHTVFITAGSDEKCAACVKLGADHAINYHKEDFVEAIKQKTSGKGVNVVLDMVGGDYIEKNLRSLGQWGRLVNIAFQRGNTATVNFGPLIMKKLSFMATTLRSRTPTEKGQIRDALLKEAWPLIEAGKIKPVVDRVMKLSEAQAAHAHMASSNHIGKILLTP
jgi:NADPH2:quinone reductase